MKRSMAALVIGNGAYVGCNVLKNPVNDAEDMTEKLESYGFHVITAIDATLAEMDRKLRDFTKLLEDNSVGLFFFAGHGLQIEGVNYLLAVDTKTDDEVDAKHSSLSLNKVIDTLAKSKASMKVMILDACRNNPWERAWHRDASNRGLASVFAPKGTIIGFATSPGEVAADGKGRNGTYTAALLQHIDTPDCSIETMFKRVRNTVAADTAGRQTTWEHTSLSGDFFFNISLSKAITEYSEEAISDSLFIIDPKKTSHKIIQGLRSHNWYRQNPAVSLLDAESANKMNEDNLFVIGRNIYQAACGTATNACMFIVDFIEKTSDFDSLKKKALLDGMLFEIFFDSSGNLRKSIKDKYFNEVFSLERNNDLRSSFEFIRTALVAARGDFFVLPGSGKDLSATVATKKHNDHFRVTGVFVGGINILRPEDDESNVPEDERVYYTVELEDLPGKLSVDLVVPTRHLKLAYTPVEVATVSEIKYPYGWTARKG